MKSNIIILLETATDACSVAFAEGDKIVAEKCSFIPKAHEVLLADLVKDILTDYSLKASDCQAVAVSSGPGSYMGLRIGASLAKGLAYGADIKLLGVTTTNVIAQCALDNNLPQKIIGDFEQSSLLIAPMIDAGRMEVYTALYNTDCEEIEPIEAKILTASSYSKQLQKHKILFTGNGAAKYCDFLKQQLGLLPENAFFAEQTPRASGLRKAAFKALQLSHIEDVAYFQPFYLKEFVPGKSKKLL